MAPDDRQVRGRSRDPFISFAFRAADGEHHHHLDAGEEAVSEEGKEPKPLARWEVYVGPSLCSKDAEPVEVFMDYDVLGALWANERFAWRGVLAYIEDDLKRSA